MDNVQRSKLIEEHIEECKHRIGVVNNFMKTNEDADESNCCRNIMRLKAAISAMQELQEYRELEEKELLIKLPCKIGSTIYRIYMDCPKDFKDEYCTDHEGSCGNCHHRTPVIYVGAFLLEDITEYGKRVFSTRESAEKALEEMKNE